MSKFIVRCIFNGTELSLSISARNAATAIERARKCRLGKRASAYIVVDRKMGYPRLTGVNK